MIGIIGAGIGTVFDDGGEIPYQHINIEGYILISDADCACSSDDCGGCLDVKVVQGNDIRIGLIVKDLSDTIVPIDDITMITWTLVDAAGVVKLTKYLGAGIELDTKIILTLEEVDLDIAPGEYIHQFVLEFNGTSVATVVKDVNLTPGIFFIRQSSPA